MSTKGEFVIPPLGSYISFSEVASDGRRIDVDAQVIQIIPDGVQVKRFDNGKFLFVTMEEVDTIPK